MAVFTLVASAIAAISAWTLSLGALGTFAIGNFLLQTAVSLGISALAKKFAGKPDLNGLDAGSEPFAIQASMRTGGEVPRSLMLGPSLTAGSLVWHTEWGGDFNRPNAYYTQVIALSDIPISGLTGIFINGTRATLAAPEYEETNGIPLVEYYEDRNHVWVRFHDGTQTTADDFLVNTVSPDAPRAYTADRIGTGVAYVVVTYRINAEMFTGLPTAKFVVDGVPLYDISKDTTEGGTGLHRWDDPSSWGGAGDSNPMVQAYNLARGITYQGNWFYGLQGLTSARLPAAHWISQIEKCNVVAGGDTSGNPIYQCAGEITVNSEMGAAFEAILTSCAGRMSEVGGVFKAYAGAADPSIASFTDADIISTAPQTFTPFFGLSRSVNGATASYPSPDEGYVMRQTPPVYNPDYEAEDGGRRLLTNVSLSFVPWPVQAQRLLIGELRAARRARRHTFTLPARYRRVEPGDTVDFTSVRNGYDAKLFRVDGIIDLPDCDLIVDMTEVDPTDHASFDINGEYVPVIPSDVLPVRPSALGVVDFDALPATIDDGNGAARRAAILMKWNNSLDLVSGIEFEVRLFVSTATVGAYSTLNFEAGELIVEAGLVPNTAYAARARYIPEGGHGVAWTSWIPVTTPNVLFTTDDIGPNAIDWTQLGQDVRDVINESGNTGSNVLAAQIAQAAAEAAEDGAVIAQGLTISAQDNAIAAVGALLPADVGEPIEHWTNSATTAVGYPKPASNPVNLVTGDPDFGSGLEAAGINRAYGPAYPTAFDRSRSYLVTARVKCTDPGTTGVRVQMGFSTFGGAGLVAYQANAAAEVDPALFVIEGVKTYALLIKPITLTDLGAFTAFDKSINHTDLSNGADAITPHVRLNGGNTTDGTGLIGFLEIRDITDALAANISARASYNSEAAALAYRTTAGEYAGAADQSRLDAETANDAAVIARADAVEAAEDAEGSRALAVSAKDLAVSAKNAAEDAEVAAGVYENATALALTGAQDAAGGAVFARDVSAKLLGGGQNPNPVFLYPDSGVSVSAPDSHSVSAGGGSSITREPTGGKYGACVEFATGSDLSTAKPSLTQSSANNPLALNASDVDAVEVTLEIEMIGGTWGSARIAANWFAGTEGTTKNVLVYLADAITSRNGKVQKLTFLAEKPEGYAPGSNDDFRLILLGNVVGHATYTSADFTARVHRMDYAVVSQSASALIMQRALTDIEGNAEAALVFRAKAGGVEGAVEIVAWDDASGVGAGSKVILTGDEIELNGLAVFKDGLESDGFVSGGDTPGFHLDKNGLEIVQLIASSAIIGGAVQREFVRGRSSSLPLTASEVEVIPETAIDFLEYDATPWAGNPALVTVTGSFFADSTAPHLVGIYCQGKFNGSDWRIMTTPNLYFTATGGVRNVDFCKVIQDPNLSYSLDKATHIRWMARVFPNAYYTGTTGTLGSDLLVQVRQVNTRINAVA